MSFDCFGGNACNLYEVFPENERLPSMKCIVSGGGDEAVFLKLRELSVVDSNVTDNHQQVLQDVVRDLLVKGGGSCFDNLICRSIYLGPGGLHFAQPNSPLKALHSDEWHQVHTAIGTAAFRMLLSETQLFVPIQGTTGFIQLCGGPFKG